LIALTLTGCVMASPAEQCKRVQPNSDTQNESRRVVVSGPLKLKDVEAQSVAKLKSYPKAPQVPFGLMNKEWTNFKEDFAPGDQLLFVRVEPSPPAEHGLELYVQVRDGCVVDEITTGT
jgi:hypothetical protein